jgi:hypothetical protein
MRIVWFVQKAFPVWVSGCAMTSVSQVIGLHPQSQTEGAVKAPAAIVVQVLANPLEEMVSERTKSRM